MFHFINFSLNANVSLPNSSASESRHNEMRFWYGHTLNFCNFCLYDFTIFSIVCLQRAELCPVWWAFCSQPFSCREIDWDKPLIATHCTINSRTEIYMRACTYTTQKYTHASIPTIHLWKAPGPQACWEIISRASKRGNSVIARRKKGFFNGEKWDAGEELAVAAKIIGNCMGTRLRFMGRTTHEGWKLVCAGGMKDMRQHFDWPAALIDRVPSQMQHKKEKLSKNFTHPYNGG